MGDLSCQNFVDLLGDYVDGRVPNAELAAMGVHRLACASCRELQSEYERVPGLVRQATDVAMPRGARARLRRLLSRAWRRRPW
jgi:anti-sigma factor RsiW